MTQKDLQQIGQLINASADGLKADQKLAFSNQFEDIKQFTAAEIRRSEERLEERMGDIIDERLVDFRIEIRADISELRDEIIEAFNQNQETMVELHDDHEVRISKLENGRSRFAVA
jgi:predicted house-cleaning noncanonical NTP pyrophosphatase (MazG superfamily)